MKRREMSLPADVRTVLDTLTRAGFAAYVVGGAVRDLLEGKTPHDYDLCTSARPEQVKQACSKWKILDTGLKHGTVTVMAGSLPLEITTFRKESAYSDCRRPDKVRFVDSPEEDLARRDFTINAMAWNPALPLCDPFGGQEDLKACLLRCVGDPETRMNEDALRILRGLRFVSEKGFRVEPETEKALHSCRKLLRYVSAERITGELLRILCGPYVGTVLMQYHDIITEIMPELAPMVGFAQHNSHHKYDVWEHAVRSVEAVRSDPLLRMVMLLHDVGKTACYTQDSAGTGHFYGHAKMSVPIARAAMCHLRLDHLMESDILYLVRHHDTPLGLTPRNVRRKLAVHGERHYRSLLAVHKADCVGQGVTQYNLKTLTEYEELFETVLEEEGRLKRRDLAVNGTDLKQWGLNGPEIGDMLAALLNYVIDDPKLNTREQLYRMVRQLCCREDRAEFTVNGMSWDHCANEVRAVLENLDCVRQAEVDLPSGRVVVTGSHISLAEIRQALAESGYEVAI